MRLVYRLPSFLLALGFSLSWGGCSTQPLSPGVAGTLRTVSVAREVKNQARWTTIDSHAAEVETRKMYGEVGGLVALAMSSDDDTSEAKDLDKVFNSHGYRVEEVVRREFVAAANRHRGLHVTEQPGPLRTTKPSRVDADDLPLFDDSKPVPRLADRQAAGGRFGDAQFRLTIKKYGMETDDAKMRPSVELWAELVDARGQILGKAEGGSDEDAVPSAFAQAYFDRPALFAEHLGAAARSASEEILRKIFDEK